MSEFHFGSGARSFAQSINRWADAIERLAKKELDTLAAILADEWRAQVSRPGGAGGRAWGRGQLGSGLRRSRPGEAPLLQSGELRESIHTRRISESVVRVSADTAHAAILEFGSRHVQPRPHARPALTSARNRMGQAFAAKLRSDKK